jgi:phage terminase large subunit
MDNQPLLPDDSSLEIARRYRAISKATTGPRADEYREYIIKRSREDIVFWYCHFCWGFSPDRPRESASPLLPYPYIRRLLSAVEAGGLLAIDKSRWVGVTYAILALYLWEWLFKPGTSLAFVSRTGADVDDGTEGSLTGKLLFLLNHLPSWLIPRWEIVHTPRVRITNLDNGSTIVGWKAVATAFHGPRYSRIFVDEASRISCLRLLMTGVLNATPNPIVCGTPYGPSGYFPELIHGKAGDIKTFDRFDKEEWSTYTAWHHMRFHYSMDPRKTPEWAAAKKATMLPEAWAEQFEINYQASAPGRIWPEWRRDIHIYSSEDWNEIVSAGYLESARIIEAWDVGSGNWVACVWVAWLDAQKSSIVLDHRSWYDPLPEQVSTDLSLMRAEFAPKGIFSTDNPMGFRPDLRVSDPAVRTPRQLGSDKRSWATLLKEKGIELQAKGITGRVPELQTRVRRALIDERIRCSPRVLDRWGGAPSLAEAIEGYHRHVDSGGVESSVAEKDNTSHLCDALQYALDWTERGKGVRTRKTVDGVWRDT